ncbi:MAG TPA: DUF4349 domain-containing protein [Cytophagales bacterium]|nr:DUF4349 domain-containing protein [Cytophagales bacterium]
MKQIKINMFLLLLLIALAGCSAKETHEAIGKVSTIQMLAPPPAKTPVKMEEDQRKLIKEGNISFRTDNLVVTRERILQAVNLYKGYISSDHESKTDYKISHILTIRIPASSFDDLLKEVTKGVNYFDFKEIEVRDVTEEFLDVQARVNTKKELEKRYLELVKQAKKVSEILEIEKEIGQLRSDIEAMEGKLNYMQKKIAFSTLTITFYEPLELVAESAYGNKFKDGFKNGLESLILFFVGIVNIWPFIVMSILALTGFRYWRKRIVKG